MLTKKVVLNIAIREVCDWSKLRFSSDSGASKYVQIRDENRNGLIRRIVMVNDKEKNALSLDAIKHLQKSISDTDLNKFRMVVLTAEKRNVFSSGKLSI